MRSGRDEDVDPPPKILTRSGAKCIPTAVWYPIQPVTFIQRLYGVQKGDGTGARFSRLPRQGKAGESGEHASQKCVVCRRWVTVGLIIILERRRGDISVEMSPRCVWLQNGTYPRPRYESQLPDSRRAPYYTGNRHLLNY